MKLILVPHSSRATDANLWICATDTDKPPDDFMLTIEKVRDEVVRKNDWQPVEVGSLKIADTKTYVQVKNLSGLTPHAQFQITAGPTRASFSTLPSDVPLAGENPLTVLLGSCFYSGNDVAPLIGAAIEKIRPDVKILCGDQVYLDVPEVTFMPLAEKALSHLFLSKYLRNWSDETGYQALLRKGSSYLTADDHEFWNNHPNRAVHIPNTLTEGGRKRLAERALQLFKSFQCEDPERAGHVQEIEIGRLSFRIMDTRVFREPGNKSFMDPEDLKAVVKWLQDGKGPKILVVGQPLFEKPTSFLTRTFVDRVLPDYEQYNELVLGISKAKNSVVVLTGDVHYSRVAAAVFRTGVQAPEVIEVISSPTALAVAAAGVPVGAPERFPMSAISGLASAVTSMRAPARADNNFATLEFTQTSGQINMRVQHIYLKRPQGNTSSPVSSFPEVGPAVNLPLF